LGCQAFRHAHATTHSLPGILTCSCHHRQTARPFDMLMPPHTACQAFRHAHATTHSLPGLSTCSCHHHQQPSAAIHSASMSACAQSAAACLLPCLASLPGPIPATAHPPALLSAWAIGQATPAPWCIAAQITAGWRPSSPASCAHRSSQVGVDYGLAAGCQANSLQGLCVQPCSDMSYLQGAAVHVPVQS
jgi:hypothetical protein